MTVTTKTTGPAANLRVNAKPSYGGRDNHAALCLKMP